MKTIDETPAPVSGPDKQHIGLGSGAITGAITGGTLGANFTAATGPGAFIGAGFGALYGGVRGYFIDIEEENQIARLKEAKEVKDEVYAQTIILEQLETRMHRHPTRDIYPSDLFFHSDSYTLDEESKSLAFYMGKYFRQRLPWSGITVVGYVDSNDIDINYSKKLGIKRAQAIALQFVRAGVNPRRLKTKAILGEGPIVYGEGVEKGIYNQAIEVVFNDNQIDLSQKK